MAQPPGKKKRAGSRRDELCKLKEDPAEAINVTSANADRDAALKEFLAASHGRSYPRPGAGN